MLNDQKLGNAMKKPLSCLMVSSAFKKEEGIENFFLIHYTADYLGLRGFGYSGPTSITHQSIRNSLIDLETLIIRRYGGNITWIDP